MRTNRRLSQVCAAVSLLGLHPSCSASHEKSPLDDVSPAESNGAPQGGTGATGTDGGVNSGGSAVDPTQPAAPGVAPIFAPKFPGAGTSGDDAPLTNGELCDYVPANGAPSPNDITTCFFGPNNPVPAATLEQVLECVDGSDVVHVRLSFNPNFVDNTYGSGAIGWPHRRGHTWADLYKSDHAEIQMLDDSGKAVLQFKLDYVSADPLAESGYASQGVSGGDGSVSLGNPAWILDYATSIDKNLNERGYAGYVVDSPATDANYTANPAAPAWDFRVVYEAWVDVSAFGAAGFGGASIEYVHASPAKGGSDTIEVTPGKCPPPFCTNPDGCGTSPPPDQACVPAPDAPCGNGGEPPPPPVEECVPTPDAPCGTGGGGPPGTPDPCANGGCPAPF
jgi:hypothetical protein